MTQKRTLTQEGMTIWNMLFILLSVAGASVSLYLTKHFYDVRYPVRGLGVGGSGCDISSFFNCDAATFSSIAEIAGVPLSIFGLFVSLIFLGSTFLGGEKTESTNKTIALVNAIGCLALFVYSIAVLGSLCPFCTAYYVVSILIFILFWKRSSLPFAIAPKPLIVYFILFAALAGFSYYQTNEKQAAQASLSSQIIDQFFNQLEDKGAPQYLSPFNNAKATEDFTAAPIWIAEFSDFQCPFCQRVAEQLHKLERLFKGKINIKYYFYPLDSNCNSEMKNQVHPFACKAAYIASCSEQTFNSVHDEIFANQTQLSDDFLKTLEQKHGLSGCLENPETKAHVENTLKEGAHYGVHSTPTMIINGRKVEGALPLIQFKMLFEEIIRRNQK